jgi:hypothetical protein
MTSVMPRWLFSFAVILLAMITRSAPALASLSFPPAIQSELSLAKAPDCTLCHRTDAGGFGTVTRPFGRTMMTQFGLMAANVAALRSALAGSDAAKLDSDQDGTSDIDELRMGTDPNVGLSGMETGPDVPLPQTGCSLNASLPSSPLSAGAALVVAVVGFSLQRRRSARATRTSRIRNRLRIRA